MPSWLKILVDIFELIGDMLRWKINDKYDESIIIFSSKYIFIKMTILFSVPNTYISKSIQNNMM